MINDINSKWREPTYKISSLFPNEKSSSPPLPTLDFCCWSIKDGKNWMEVAKKRH